MTDTGLHNLDAALQTFNVWLRELDDKLHFENRKQSFKALKVTLHALRDQLTINQSAHLSAQLPMIARGIYFEGWVPARVPVKERHLDQFLAHVRDNFDQAPGGSRVDPRRIAIAVFELLNQHITPGEIEDVRGELPEEVRRIWPSPTANGSAQRGRP